MTFYEELGVPPDAPQDAIREAYRNVARLLHPDAQTNPVLKESAEAQMKRINHLYNTLSDPQRRRRYDQELAEPQDRPGTIIIQAPAPSEQFQTDKRGTMAWLAATGICAMFIIWLASRESTPPAVYPQLSSAPGASGSATGSSSSSSVLRRAAGALQPRPGTDRHREDEILRLRAELAAANADRERLMKLLAVPPTEHRFQPPPPDFRQAGRATVAVLPTPSALAVQTRPLEISLPIATTALLGSAPRAAGAKPAAPLEPGKMKWSGSWAYPRSPGNAKSKALFPPEFIETTINEENGRIWGQYHARFRVANPKISPDVDFSFEGRVSGISGRFSWTGSGGARGEGQIRLVSDSSLEVVWTATGLGKTMGLASGTAVLNRKN